MRVLLVRHAGTRVTRRAVVPDDEDATAPLDDLTGWLGRTGRVLTSPARRCRWPGAAIEPLLRPWDLGRWTGRPMHELDLAAWRSDAAYDAHGGESLLALVHRVEILLARWRGESGRVAAVTHAGVIKAAVVQALGAPPQAVWGIDVHPGSATELHADAAGRWRLVTVNAPVPQRPRTLSS